MQFGTALGKPVFVEVDQPDPHPLRRGNRVLGVVGVVERRVPKRHDAIADVFVDRSLVLHDDLGHRRQEFVDQVAELLRGQTLRHRRKPADVAEHDGDGADLAAELQFFRIFGEFGDVMRREITREGFADLALLGLGQAVVEELPQDIDARQHGERIHGVD